MRAASSGPLQEDPAGALRSLLHHVSHDLRQPIRHVVSFAEILQSEESDALSEDGRMCLEQILRAGTSLQRMVDGLLTLARVHSAEDPPEPVDLAEIVQTIDDTFRVRGAATPLLRWGALPVVLGHRTQLAWLLGELVDNATRSKPDGVVTVTISAHTADGLMELSVVDDGNGIPADALDHVFDVLNGFDEDRAGTGLATARAVCARHGGSITIDPMGGQGTRMVLALPALVSAKELAR